MPTHTILDLKPHHVQQITWSLWMPGNLRDRMVQYHLKCPVFLTTAQCLLVSDVLCGSPPPLTTLNEHATIKSSFKLVAGRKLGFVPAVSCTCFPFHCPHILPPHKPLEMFLKKRSGTYSHELLL